MQRLYFAAFLLTLLIGRQALASTPQPAPDIAINTIDKTFKLSDLKGQVVYLDFWASWCVPCRKSFPFMQQMQQKYRNQGLKIIAVNLDKEQKLADIFLKKFDVSFTIGFDKVGDSASAYQLQGMPSTYLIGRDGKLYGSHIGFREKDRGKLEHAIQILLKQEKS